MPWLIIGGLAALGYFIKNTGEGVNKASNGAIKLAVTGAVLYIGAKKLKVIK